MSKSKGELSAKNFTQHRSELNKKLLESGFKNFSDEEIIELMLCYCVPINSVRSNTEKILKHFNCISDVLDADPGILMKMGISENAAVFFRMITAMSGHYYNSANWGVKYDNADKLIGLFRPYFTGLYHEEFRIACFKKDMSLIMTESISEGSGVRAEVNYRILIEAILRNDCSVVAVSHNHPNTSAEPSDADLNFTSGLYKILRSLDIKLVDHIIIGKFSALSLKEKYPGLFADNDEDKSGRKEAIF